MAGAIELAVGYLTVIPEMRRVGPAIKREFTQAERQAPESGKRMGKSMSSSYVSQFQSTGSQVGEKISRGVGSSARGQREGRSFASAFVGSVGRGMAAVGTAFAVITGAATSTVRNIGGIALGLGIAARAARVFSAQLLVGSTILRSMSGAGVARLAGVLRLAARAAGILARDISRVTGALLALAAVARVVGMLNSLGKSLAKITVGSAVALGAVSALGSVMMNFATGPMASGLLAVAAAMGTVAAAAAGILGPALAVAALAMKGMQDGAKAWAEAQKPVASSSKATASAMKSVEDAKKSQARTAEQGNRQIVDAEKSVVTAQKSVQKAQEAVNDARRDARREAEGYSRTLRGLDQDEEGAALALAEARESMRETLASSDSDATDRWRAEFGVREAELALEEIKASTAQQRADISDAQSKGIEGSDQVVSAKEREVEANEQLGDAQSQLAQTQKDVAQANVDAAEAVADAYASVAEAQQQAASTIDPFAAMIGERMAPTLSAFRALREEVTDKFTGALVGSFGQIGGLLGGLTPQLGGLATTLGTIGAQIANSISSPEAVAGLDRMIAGSKKFFDSFAGDKSGIGNLFSGLIQVLGTAADTFAGTGATINDFLFSLGERLKGISADDLRGSLSGISQAFTNIGQVVGPVFDLLRQFGAESASGLAPGFVAFGQAISDSIPGLMNLARTIMPALGEAMANLAPVLPKLVDAFTPWGNLLALLLPHLGSLIEKLAPMAPLLLAVVTAMKLIGVAVTVWNAAMFAASVSQGIFAAATGRSAATLGANTIALTAHRVALIAGSVASNVAAVATRALGAALRFAMGPIGWVITAVAALAAGLVWLYKNNETFRNFVTVAWNGIKAAIAVVWNWLSTSVFPFFESVLRTIGAAAMWLWQNAIVPAWEGIQSAISFAWNNIIRPVFDAITGALGAVGDFFAWVWNSVIKPAWSALASGIEWYWENVIVRVFDAYMAVLRALGDAFTWVWESVIKPVWDALGKGIAWVWDNVISPAFDAFKDGLKGVGDFFGQVVDGIQITWDRIKDIVRKPIEFMVNTIYNEGIVPAWNSIAGFIGLDDKKLSTIEGFKSGGVYPGYTPGRDTGVIAVGGGEAIMRPEWTRAVGPGYVDAANSAARGGGVSGVKKFLGAYADGGIVGSMKRIVDAKFPGMSLTSGLRFTDDGYHSKGMAADFSDGGNAGTPTMKALAGFIADNYAPDTIELIHSPFDRNIGGGGFVGDGMGFYGAGTMSEHRDHVHWAVGHELGEPSGGSIMSSITGALGGAVNWVRNKVADLFEKPVRALGDNIPDFGGAPWAQTGRGIYDKIADASIAFVRGKADEKDQASSPSSAFVAGAGAEQWRGMMIEAYRKQGYDPTPAKIDAWVKQIHTESGGDPNIAQQIMDVNGTGEAAGVGLGQMIPTTWQAYRDPSLPDNRRDPWAMTNAMVRYGEQKYGESLLDVIGHGHGYDQGGIFKNNTLGWNTSGKPEAVLTNDQWQLFSNFNDVLAQVGPQFIKKFEDIAPKAGLEILGLDGTLFDLESNRYLKAGQEIAASAQAYQAKRSSEMAEVVQPTVNNDYSVNLVNPVFQDQNQAMRDAGNIQQRNMMRNAGRPFG